MNNKLYWWSHVKFMSALFIVLFLSACDQTVSVQEQNAQIQQKEDINTTIVNYANTLKRTSLTLNEVLQKDETQTELQKTAKLNEVSEQTIEPLAIATISFLSSLNLDPKEYFPKGLKDPDLIPFGMIMFGLELHKETTRSSNNQISELKPSTIAEVYSIMGDCACSPQTSNSVESNLAVAAPDVLHCLVDTLLDFAGIHYLKELAASYANGSITSATLAGTVKVVLKRAGGVIAVAAATYTFGDCMNWW